MPLPVDPNAQVDPNAPPVDAQLDENGNPIDESQLDTGAPPPISPMEDPNAPQGDPNDPNAQIDPNAQAGQVDPNDPNAQAPGGVPQMPPYYYNDEDEDGENDPDGDEEYPDNTGRVQKGQVSTMEPIASDTNILTEIVKSAIKDIMGSALAPLILKQNELITSHNTLAEENRTLKASYSGVVDLIKGLGAGGVDVVKATPATEANAKPANPAVSDADVTKGLDATGTTIVDPAAIANPAGAPDASDLVAKANPLVMKARSLRDDLSKSYTGAVKSDLAQALSAVQSGRVTATTISALENAITAAEQN